MQIKFMEHHIGHQFEGVISGVTERGIYVEIIENKCEGMLRIKDLPGDYFSMMIGSIAWLENVPILFISWAT